MSNIRRNYKKMKKKKTEKAKRKRCPYCKKLFHTYKNGRIRYHTRLWKGTYFTHHVHCTKFISKSKQVRRAK
jgi:hypothetical protein